jgi:hypothetical protein
VLLPTFGNPRIPSFMLFRHPLLLKSVRKYYNGSPRFFQLMFWLLFRGRWGMITAKPTNRKGLLKHGGRL